MQRIILITAICLVAILFASSCKRGCTNPSAANYDKSAKDDDASCLYCDSTNAGFLNDYNTYSDYTPNSPHYSDYVLRNSYDTRFYIYTGNGCRKLAGLSGNCAGAGLVNSVTDISFENQTNDTMVVNTRLTYFPGSSTGLQLDTVLYNIVIPPYGTKSPIKGLRFNCMQLVSGGNVTLSSTTFTYR